MKLEFKFRNPAVHQHFMSIHESTVPTCIYPCPMPLISLCTNSLTLPPYCPLQCLSCRSGSRQSTGLQQIRSDQSPAVTAARLRYHQSWMLASNQWGHVSAAIDKRLGSLSPFSITLHHNHLPSSTTSSSVTGKNTHTAVMKRVDTKCIHIMMISYK